ncbi:MAG: hypothetical protein ACJATI_003459 [Halioglobus sp.]|jgi:hypothetical protein
MTVTLINNNLVRLGVAPIIRKGHDFPTPCYRLTHIYDGFFG